MGLKIKKNDALKEVHELYKKNKNLINIAESIMTATYSFKTLTSEEIAKWAGKQMTLSCYVDNIVSEIASCWAIYVNIDGTNYAGNWLNSAGGRTSITFTIPSTATIVSFTCNRGGGSVTSGHMYNTQLEEGALATSYVPYGVEYIGEAYCKSKNLFDKTATRTLTVEDMIANRNNVLFTGCNIPNKTVGQSVPVNSDVKSINVPCQQGDTFTIYFHGGAPSGTTSRLYTCEVDSSMVLTKNTYQYSLTNNAYTFTITEANTSVLIIEMETISDLCKDVVVLVKGSTAPTEYHPYGAECIFSAGWDKSVSGTAPIQLPDARPKATSWTIEGEMRQGTLPSGYTELESITFPSGAYIDTGIIPKTFDYQVYFKGSFGVITSVGPNCAWGFMTESTIPRWLCAIWNNQYLLNANTTNGFSEADTNEHEFLGEVYNKDGDDWYKATLDGVVHQDFNLHTSTGGFSENTLSIYLGARHNATGAGNEGLITSKAFWIKKADVLIANYIPAKNSSNVLGMYDTVTGTFFTNAGTGTFTAGPTYPLPSMPLPIYGVGNSGIPSEYKKLSYLESSGTQEINTGVLLSGDNYKVETKYYMDFANKNANALFGAQYQNPLLAFYADKIFCYGDSSQTAVNRSHTGLMTNQITEVSAIFNNGTVDVNVDGNSISYSAVTNFSASHFQSYPVYLFTNNNGGTTTSQNFKGKVYYWRISQNGIILRNMIPAQRISDSEMGMYDTVTNTFYPNIGTGNFTAGLEDTSCVVPINVSGKNLFDKDTTRTLTIEDMIANRDKVLFTDCNIPNKTVGQSVPVNSDVKSINVPCRQGDTFTIYFHGGVPSGTTPRLYVCEVDSSMLLTKNTYQYSLTNNACTFAVTEANTAVLIIEMETISDLCKNVVVISRGSTAPTEYMPYFTPTKTHIYLPAPLNKISTYKDSINSNGTLKRNVGVITLDGTENWSWNGANWFYLLTTADVGSDESSELITHFKYSSSTAAWGYLKLATNKYIYVYDSNGAQWSGNTNGFKAWLQAQYNAGTPVIIYYPLATEEETQVEVPEISTSRGLNYIDTECEISPSGMSVTYRKRTQ